MIRNTALVTHDRKAWGGSYFDSLTHATMFRSYKPYDFGVMTARLFSSEIGSDLINKKFTYYTIANKNVYVLPGGTDDYTWYAMGDTDVEFRFTELLVDPASTPGKGGLQFRIAIDRDWLHEPAVIKLASSNAPLLRIIGQPTMRSANSYEYLVEMQDGDVNSFIPVSLLQPGMTAVRVTSFTSDELNTKYAPDQYGEMYKLQNWVANYGNKAEFTDKFIRTEIAARKEGRGLPETASYSVGGKAMKGAAISSGYVYQADLRDKMTGKKIQVGTFITNIEARLEERTMMDREYAMEWGRLQKTVDADSGRTIKIPAGWRQLVRDGHYMEHNGNLSLSDIQEFLNNIFITRKGFKDREIKIATGEGGIDFLSRLIFTEFSSIVTIDTLLAAKRNDPMGVHENELEYGGQFTKFKGNNGTTITLVYDPMKDNRQLFPELAPGANRTLESYSMDIFDFGVTDQTPGNAGMKNNICMVMQDGVEEFYTVSNVYNFETGAEVSGGNVYGNGKELGVYRAMSGSLNCWDTSRIGRIEFNPAA